MTILFLQYPHSTEHIILPLTTTTADVNNYGQLPFTISSVSVIAIETKHFVFNPPNNLSDGYYNSPVAGEETTGLRA